MKNYEIYEKNLKFSSRSVPESKWEKKNVNEIGFANRVKRFFKKRGSNSVKEIV